MDSASLETIGTDISHADLQAEAAADNVLEQVEEQAEGVFANVVDVSAESAMAVVPIGTLGVPVTIGGYRFLEAAAGSPMTRGPTAAIP